MKKRWYPLFMLLLWCMSFTILEANSNITLTDISIHNCPDDITVNAPTGSNGTSVSWIAPTVSTGCMVSSGADCNAVSNNISGFIYMGKYNGSKYYCSNTSNISYNSAKNQAVAAGGHLAVINSSGENEFVRNNLLASHAWIGLSDSGNEGTFKWVNNASLNYTKWASGEPNNTDPYTSNSADHVVIEKSTGKWYDRNGSYGYEYVMEIPCPSNQVPGTVSISQTQGPSSGSFFAIGTKTVKYTATDECGDLKTCTFTITVNQTDPCAGQGGDSDGDNVCDNQDCAPNNPNLPAPVGSACNDGNPNTTNDVIQGNGCDCAGTPVGPCPGDGDNDGDGVCNSEDCFPWNPTLPAPIGSPCDDGNPNTSNDVVVGNDCNCEGTNSDPCANNGGDTDGDGVCDNQDNCVNTPNPNQADSDGDGIGDACDNTDPCGLLGGDSDNDGVCNFQDNCPNNFNPNQADSNGDGIGDVCDTSNGGCTNPTNIALNKSANQSSTITANGITGSASKAVDGNTNGVFFTGNNATSSVSATQNQNQAWWEVDLGAEYNIEQVRIYNRTDGTDKTDDCYLIISSTPFAPGDLNGALAQANYSHYEQSAVGTPSVDTPPAGTTGRYVRIQLNGTGYLVLAEVEVIGCTTGGGNPCANNGGDSDGDGICNNQDNCVNTPNPNQADSDGNGVGDVCDTTDPCQGTGDNDNDGVCNAQDCYPWNPTLPGTIGASCDDGNPNTTNDVIVGDECNCEGTTGGGGGNPCDNSGGDSDGDGVCNNLDNCPNTPNPNQADSNGNGIGDVCDTVDPCQGTGDNDNDGVCNAQDCYPWNPTLPGTIGASCDDGNPNTSNDVIVGDECNCQGTISDPCANAGGDTDSDGVCNVQDCQPNDPAFPATPGSPCNDGNPNTTNDAVTSDGCGCEGVLVDPCANAGGDSDGDGVCNAQDNCVNNFNPDQADIDGDGVGDACDVSFSCNEKTLVRYNMDNCESYASNGTNLDFSEFTPSYPNNGNCVNVSASNLSTDGGHSCVDGANGSYAGICILGEPGSSFKNDDDDALRFSITVDPGSIGKLTQLSFYELSPTHYTHISGNSGNNHYLQKFGVRVLKNGTEVFKQTGLDVSQNGWDYESFSFDGNPAFEITSTATFTFEILGYKPYGGSGSNMYFDVDDIKVKGCCSSSTSQAIPNMLNFNAKKEGRHSAISWMMAKDVDVDFYEVEVSADEINFQTLGEVAADQVNVARSYDLMDYDPSNGENFYRLKVINMDGSFYYSNIRRLNYDIDFSEVTVYPNPTNDQINITLNDFVGKEGTVEIFNQLGQRQFIREYSSIPTIPVNVDVNKFVPGIYTVSIKIDNQKRFAKQFVVVDK